MINMTYGNTSMINMTYEIAIVLIIITTIAIMNYIRCRAILSSLYDEKAHVGIISDYCNEEA